MNLILAVSSRLKAPGGEGWRGRGPRENLWGWIVLLVLKKPSGLGLGLPISDQNVYPICYAMPTVPDKFLTPYTSSLQSGFPAFWEFPGILKNFWEFPTFPSWHLGNWQELSNLPSSGRGGKWYPENRGSWKIFARSWNLGNFSTESRRLVFLLFGSEIVWVLGSDFQTRASVFRILPFAIPSGICCMAHKLRKPGDSKDFPSPSQAPHTTVS